MTWAPVSGATDEWDDDLEETFPDGIVDFSRYVNFAALVRFNPIWAGASSDAETWTEA